MKKRLESNEHLIRDFINEYLPFTKSGSRLCVTISRGIEVVLFIKMQ